MTNQIESTGCNAVIYHKISSNLPAEDYECGDGTTFGFYNLDEAKLSDDHIEVPVTELGNVCGGSTSNIGDIDSILHNLKDVLAKTANNINSLSFVIRSHNGTWVSAEDATFGGDKIYL